MTQQTTTQLEQANMALVALADKVTPLDRQQALIKYSRFTLTQYLNGKGRNLDTAMELLRLFSGRIGDREREISELKS